MGQVNRRTEPRIALQMFLNQYVQDNPYRCLATNVSPNGLYVNSLPNLVTPKRKTRVLGLEFELPGTSEVIWARGEVRFDANDPYFKCTGIEITGIANSHQRLLRDYVIENRVRELRRLLATIRRNRLQ
jgi:hypothetical protein